MAGIQPLIQPLDVWRGGGWMDDGSLGLIVSCFALFQFVLPVAVQVLV